MDAGALGYLGIFLGSVILALVTTPVALRLARRLDVLDRPGAHKGHSSPVPYLGGLAIAVAFAAAVMVAALVHPPVSGLGQLAGILGIATGLALVGLLDDLRNLGPGIRLAVEIGAGVGIWALDVRVQLFTPDWFDFIVTVVWVVGITNAFNLLDNMDGLSAGVAMVAGVWFFVIAVANGQFLVASLAIGLTGCTLGFLRHNFHPARIYMGDAGALFLGFLLAAIGIRLRFDGPVQTTFMVPILVLGIAVFDTTLVTISRLRHGRSPFQGGRDHLSHRLVRVGIPVPAAVVLIYTAAAGMGGLALVLSRVDKATGFLLMAVVAGTGAVVGLLLLAVPVYPPADRDPGAEA